MYKIYADDTLIYDSTCEDYEIAKGTVTLETDKAGSFVFALYPEHFYYDEFVKMRTAITVYKDDRIVFRGRVLEAQVDHWNCKTLTCEGELAFLNDSVIRPFSDIYGHPTEMLAQFVAWHNDQVDEFKRFKVGRVTVPGATTLVMQPESTDYDTTLAAMQEHLLGAKPGGHLYVTHDDGDRIPTLNWVGDFDRTASQAIEFGENLKTYTKTVKAEELVTAILPLGAVIDDGNDRTEDKKLTIKTPSRPDYIYSPEGVALYGWIFKVVEWDKITDQDELYETAKAYLAEVVGQNVTVELNAIDLHLMDRSIESFNVCEYVHVVSEPHNFAATLLCTKQTLDLLKPQNDVVVLGTQYATFTEKSTKTANTLVKVSTAQAGASKVSQAVTDLSTRVDILEQGGGGVGVLSVVSGQSIRVTDVSPFKHDLNVSVQIGSVLDPAQMVDPNFVANEDGSYTLTKTSTDRASGYQSCDVPAGASVTFAVDRWEGTATGNLRLQVTYADGTTATLFYLNANKLTDTRTLPKAVTRFRVMLDSTEADGAYVTLTGLRWVNESAAPLETTVTYNGKDYPSAADGSVEGLVSTSPTMTLSVPSGYALTLVYYKKL